MRYYEKEHFDAYARIRRDGLDQWNDLHPADRGRGYDEFPSRTFLTRVLPAEPEDGPSVLEYGCGTGGAACFLASRGYRVHAVDLVPDAIAIARQRAAERGLSIRFAVQDICHWDESSERYDFVVDSFCLQSIVTDADRSRLFAAVRRRLQPGGRYLILTAMYSPDRIYAADDHYDPETGIVWARSEADVEDRKMINGSWHIPNRRHLTGSAMHVELEQHGFRILQQSEATRGEIVCEVATMDPMASKPWTGPGATIAGERRPFRPTER